MDDAIGCQIGCQDENGAPPDIQEVADSLEEVVSLNFTSWNRIAEWLKSVQRLKAVA